MTSPSLRPMIFPARVPDGARSPDEDSYLKRRLQVFVVITLLAGLIGLAGSSDLTRPTSMGAQGMVACGHWLAANAGADILKRGGNAFNSIKK